MTLDAKHWRVPLALVVLSLVPVAAGAGRLAGLASGAEVTPDTARFAAAPIPVALHIVSATPYCLLGAFQFSAGLRRRWPAWHRRAGRVLAGLGIVSALSGVWMAARYEIPSAMQGPLLLGVRVTVGLAMAAAIVLAVVAILRRDFDVHEAWMIRAYAMGQGAGTQVVVLGPGLLLFGDVQGLTRDLLMTLAWVLNLVVAERIIRHHRPAASAGGDRRSPTLRRPVPRGGQLQQRASSRAPRASVFQDLQELGLDGEALEHADVRATRVSGGNGADEGPHGTQHDARGLPEH